MSTNDGELDPVVLITTLAELPRLLKKEGSEQDIKRNEVYLQKNTYPSVSRLFNGSKVQGNVSDGRSL